jgi:hypothetical protein
MDLLADLEVSGRRVEDGDGLGHGEVLLRFLSHFWKDSKDRFVFETMSSSAGLVDVRDDMVMCDSIAFVFAFY